MSSGGGSSGVDTAYNDRMASIAEAQQAMAEEYFQYWKTGPGEWVETSTGVDASNLVAKTGMKTVGSGDMKEDVEYTYYVDKTTGKKYDSIEQATADNTTSRTWVPDEDGVSYLDMEQEQIKANMELIPQQTSLASAQINSELSLLPKQTEVQAGLLDEQLTNIGLRKPVTAKYYDEVLSGVNVDERVSLARADVEEAYAGAEANARRWASSVGVNPASKKYGSTITSLAKEKAAAKVGATSLARRQAEEENFARLSGAMGLSSV